MRVVITGAAGFIGSRLLEAWLRKLPSKEILAVDHPLVSAKKPNLAVAPGVAFLDHQQFLELLERDSLRPELILHMGACSSTTELNWDYLYENNVRYSQRLWEWCASNGAQFIYASSAATYGDGSCGFNDEEDIGRLQPLNRYGQSKQDFDLWVQERVKEERDQPRQCIGLKFFNVYGPGESHKGRMASMVFHGFKQIKSHGWVRLFKSHRPEYGDGDQLRDFIYVHDVVRVIDSLAARPQVSGLFNLGTGHAISFREMIESLFVAVGREPRIEYIPMPEDIQGKYQYFTQATMKKLAWSGIAFTPMPVREAVANYAGHLIAALA